MTLLKCALAAWLTVLASSPAYAQGVLRAIWEFDGNYDASNDHTWDGLPNGPISFVPGVRGQGIDLNGGTGTLDDPAIAYVDSSAAFPSYSYASGFSVMAWIRVDAPVIADLINHDASSCPSGPCTNDRFGFSFAISNSEQLNVQLRDTSDRRWIVETTIPRPDMIGNWTHVAATFDGGASPS